MKEIDQANINIDKIENLGKDPEYFIYEYFEEIKRQVDWRREDLKLKIDTYSNEIIHSIESAKKNCFLLATKVNQLSKEIENCKNELNKLIHHFNIIDPTNENKLVEIEKNGISLNESLAKKLAEYKDSLLDNKKYLFIFKETPIDDFFGHFNVIKKVNYVFCIFLFELVSVI